MADTITVTVSEVPANLVDLIAAEGATFPNGDYLPDVYSGAPVAYIVERSAPVADPANLKPGGGHPPPTVLRDPEELPTLRGRRVVGPDPRGQGSSSQSGLRGSGTGHSGLQLGASHPGLSAATSAVGPTEHSGEQ